VTPYTSNKDSLEQNVQETNRGLFVRGKKIVNFLEKKVTEPFLSKIPRKTPILDILCGEIENSDPGVFRGPPAHKVGW